MMYLVDMVSLPLAPSVPSRDLTTMKEAAQELTLASVFRIQTILKPLADGTMDVPHDVADAGLLVREVMMHAARTYDSSFSKNLVEGFWRVSGPLGLADDEFRAALETTLMDRLVADITERPSQFNHFRIEATLLALDHMGVRVTGETRDRIVDAVYETFTSRMHLPDTDLTQAMDLVDATLSGMKFHLSRHPGIAQP